MTGIVKEKLPLCVRGSEVCRVDKEKRKDSLFCVCADSHGGTGEDPRCSSKLRKKGDTRVNYKLPTEISRFFGARAILLAG